MGRDLTRSLKQNEKDRALLSAFGMYAEKTDIKLYAEGVEDAHTLELIRQAGVYAFQGYYVSQPVPFEAFLASLKPSQE